MSQGSTLYFIVNTHAYTYNNMYPEIWYWF